MKNGSRRELNDHNSNDVLVSPHCECQAMGLMYRLMENNTWRPKAIPNNSRVALGQTLVRSRRHSPINLARFMKNFLPVSGLAVLLGFFGAIAIGGLAAGCASTPTSDSTGQYVDDTSITTKVKSALLGDDSVKSFEIKVETVKGVVQLSGFVDTSAQKYAAEKDASGVAGVKSVQNSLIVK